MSVSLKKTKNFEMKVISVLESGTFKCVVSRKSTFWELMHAFREIKVLCLFRVFTKILKPSSE